jgi:GTPase-associated system helical domain
MSEAPTEIHLTVVDAFLSANLLAILGQDEDRYNAITSTVVDLVEAFVLDKAELIQFALAAFLPSPKEKEPQVQRVYTALKVHWRTVDNLFKQEKPIMLYRAIMLEVLSQLISRDPLLASIIYHANASVFPHLKYGREEVKIISDLLEQAGTSADQLAAEEWFGTGEVSESERSAFVIPTVSKTAFSTDTFENQLLAATGPQEATKYEPRNTFWPHSQPVEWGGSFSKVAAQVIGSAITTTTNAALNDYSKNLAKLLSKELETLGDEFKERAAKGPKQLELLWWMQALYSPSQRGSYRDLESHECAVVASFDLNHLVQAPIPESVIHILGEAVLNATSGSTGAVSLEEWLAKLQAGTKFLGLPGSKLLTESLPSGIKPLLTLVRAAFAQQKPSKGDLEHVANVKLTPRQFAMWLFRDLMCEQLSQGQ